MWEVIDMSYLQLTKELIWKDDHNRGKHDVKAINLWYKTPKNVWMGKMISKLCWS
jgi:hypothetical protein